MSECTVGVHVEYRERVLAVVHTALGQDDRDEVDT
jgi:hypothetical protein